jgi:hypothetical protein
MAEERARRFFATKEKYEKHFPEMRGAIYSSGILLTLGLLVLFQDLLIDASGQEEILCRELLRALEGQYKSEMRGYVIITELEDRTNPSEIYFWRKCQGRKTIALFSNQHLYVYATRRFLFDFFYLDNHFNNGCPTIQCQQCDYLASSYPLGLFYEVCNKQTFLQATTLEETRGKWQTGLGNFVIEKFSALRGLWCKNLFQLALLGKFLGSPTDLIARAELLDDRGPCEESLSLLLEELAPGASVPSDWRHALLGDCWAMKQLNRALIQLTLLPTTSPIMASSQNWDDVELLYQQTLRRALEY